MGNLIKKWLLKPVLTGFILALLCISAQSINTKAIDAQNISQENQKNSEINNLVIKAEEIEKEKPELQAEETQAPESEEVNAEINSPASQPNPVITPKEEAGLEVFGTVGEELPTATITEKNKKTNNLNTLFIGVDGDQLLMCSVYSVNHLDKMQSASIFIPTYALVPGKNYSFAEMYKEKGVQGLIPVVEKELQIKLKNYVKVDKELFSVIDNMIDPIYVGQEQVELDTIFTRKQGPEDSYIMGQLMERFMNPKTFFINIPKLILSSSKHIETNFSMKPDNLLLYYKITKQIETAKIEKLVLPVNKTLVEGKERKSLALYEMKNSIFDLTNK